MEWLSSKSKCPERSRWKPYYLLWFSLGSTITTSAVAIKLPKFKGWEHRFHLSIRSVSKLYYKKRIWNGSCRDGKLRKYNLSHCLFFNGDLPELLVSFVVGHSYSLSSLDGADSWQWQLQTHKEDATKAQRPPESLAAVWWPLLTDLVLVLFFLLRTLHFHYTDSPLCCFMAWLCIPFYYFGDLVYVWRF